MDSPLGYKGAIKKDLSAICLERLAVDIDEDWTLEGLKLADYTSEYGGFIYTTVIRSGIGCIQPL